MKLRCTIIAALLVLTSSAAWAQTIVCPTEIEVGKLARCSLVTTIPEGARIADGGWEVICENVKQTADVELLDGRMIFTGLPGIYTVVFDGAIVKDVTFNIEGSPITITSYLGKIKGRSICTIKGGQPDPGPNPPDPLPPSDQKYQVVVIHQAGEQLDNLPQSQRDLITSLQVRQEIASMGHVIHGFRDDNVFSADAGDKLRPFISAAKASGLALPVIVLSPRDKQEVPKAYALPLNWTGLQDLLNGKVN